MTDIRLTSIRRSLAIMLTILTACCLAQAGEVPWEANQLCVDLGNHVADKIEIGVDEDDPDGLRVWMQICEGVKLRFRRSDFTDVLLPLFKLRSIETDDRISIEEHPYLDWGYITRTLKVSHANLSCAAPATDVKMKAIRAVERLTGFGALGHEFDLNGKTMPAVLLDAARNSLRVADGTGLLIRWRDRLVVLTANHVADNNVTRRFPSGVPVTIGKQLHSAAILVADQGIDLAVLEFVEPKVERTLRREGWGFSLRESNLRSREFVFQLGFPNTWPLNRRHTDRWHRGKPTERTDCFNLVLTSGILALTDEELLVAECPSVSGNSGGGVFIFDRNGQVRLIGIAHSTTFTGMAPGVEVDQGGDARHVPIRTILRLLGEVRSASGA